MLTALISTLCIAVAVVGCGYTLSTVFVVRSFFRGRGASHGAAATGITVLKPLHGAEPDLYENLLSFLSQDYAGAVQLLIGISEANDTARPIVDRLIAAFPERDIELVIGARRPEGNGKIGNLAQMSAAIKHELIVMSDSDIRVRPDYLRQVNDALSQPDVGLVTCLYNGCSEQGLWARLSSMSIDFQFFPAVLLGIQMGKARPCMGATMAFSRPTLESIGGFRAFAGHLADDYAIGEAVRALGRSVVVAPHIVVHRCNERSATELFLHELRWARTIRSIDPKGYAGSFIAYPLPFALAAVALRYGDAPSLAALAATLVCRALLQWQVERTMGLSTRRWMLGPMRDLLSFVVFCASFVTDVVIWRGRRYRIRADGTMEELKGLTS